MYILLLTDSTAQLLEPFCRENDIRVSMLGSDIDRQSGMHSVMHHSTTGPMVSSTGGELEDPPGLYEKVHSVFQYY